MSTDAEIRAQLEEHKATRRLIQQERDTIAVEAQRFGQDLLDARRRLDLFDPDGKTWGQRMLRYQVGLRALALGMSEPAFTIESVPTQLREWLTNPLTDLPASDEDLTMLAELITQREQQLKETA